MIDLTSEHDGQEPVAGGNLQMQMLPLCGLAQRFVRKTSLAGAIPPTAKKSQSSGRIGDEARR